MPKPQGKITFIQHSRQSYASAVKLGDGVLDEFFIGDYSPYGGVRRGGELKITLQDHRHVGGDVEPYLHAFGDSMGTLEWLMANGLDAAMHSLGFGRKRISNGFLVDDPREPDAGVFRARLEAMGVKPHTERKQI